MVVREDEAVLADDEPGPRSARRLLARSLASGAVAPAAWRRLLVVVLLARVAEEAMEEVVRRSAAAEEVGEIVAPRFHLGPDVDDDGRRHFRDVPERLRVERAGDRSAVHRRDRDGLRRGRGREIEPRRDHHADEERGDHQEQCVENRGLAGRHRYDLRRAGTARLQTGDPESCCAIESRFHHRFIFLALQRTRGIDEPPANRKLGKRGLQDGELPRLKITQVFGFEPPLDLWVAGQSASAGTRNVGEYAVERA